MSVKTPTRNKTLNDRIIGGASTWPNDESLIKQRFIAQQTKTREEIEINRKKTIKSQFDVVINCCPSSARRLIEIPAVNLILIHRSRKCRLMCFAPKTMLLQHCVMRTWKIAIDSRFILDNAPHCLLQCRSSTVEYKNKKQFHRLYMDSRSTHSTLRQNSDISRYRIARFASFGCG